MIAALGEREPRRGVARSRCGREAADEFDAASARRRWRERIDSGCTNWYVDEDGNDPSEWPWT